MNDRSLHVADVCRGIGTKGTPLQQSIRRAARMTTSEMPRPSAERQYWALVGRKRGNTAKSASRPNGKLRILLLTAGGLAAHLIGRLVFSQPDVNRVPQ